MYVVYHLKGFFCHSKMKLIFFVVFLVFLFYHNLFKAFFHKYSYIFKLLKPNECN